MISKIGDRRTILIAFLMFVGLGLSAGLLGVAWPYMQDEFNLDLDAVIHHDSQLAWLAADTGRHPLRVWLKLDTGMHRLGFPAARAEESELVARAQTARVLRLSDVFSEVCAIMRSSRP